MKHPERGTRVWVQLNGKKIAGIVLASGFSANGDYDVCKIELLIVNTLAPGGQQLLRQVYPKPIQSYKLTKRHDHEILPGEAAHETTRAME